MPKKTARPNNVPPKYLSEAAKKEWQRNYDAELDRSKVNHPDNENAQHTAALKHANRILTIPAPTSAKELDALEPWQVVSKKTTKVDGQEYLVAVTIDGRKHSHPVIAKK